ncbi:FAD/NAD(P)-binding domain-containing protein [Wilcoxina mikolae CBS 423.85]|nr:FAD/NAD(P)-binding domain-containing protein [Wilcoxina mikolae CBS 423.85]
MEQFLAVDCNTVRMLCDLGVYEYVIVGSGIGGGILAEELAKKKRKVLLIERGGPTFSTHICNTARPDFSRGKDDSPEGNEVVYNTIKQRVQTAEDSEPYVGGPIYCLGGRSNIWGLWIPQIDSDTLEEHFPKKISDDLQGYAYRNAFNLVTNHSQTDGIYPEGILSIDELNEAKEALGRVLDGMILPGHSIGLGPIATELISPAPYRFPQGAYSAVVPLLNRIYARDEYLTVLMDTEVLQVNHGISDVEPNGASQETPNSRGRIPCDGLMYVKSLTIRTTSNKQINQICTERSKVILCAGTIGTATIALNSGLQYCNPPDSSQKCHHSLVGKGLIDHEIWGVRFAKMRGDFPSKDPMNLQCMIDICGSRALLTVTINANFFLAGSTSLPIAEYWEVNPIVPMLPMDPEKGRRDIKNSSFDTIAVLIEFGAELDNRNEVLKIPAPDPVIRIRRRHTHTDEESQEEMQDLATRIRNTVMYWLNPEPFRGGIPIELPKAPRLSLLGFGVFSHEVGTMRMDGPGNRPGVVDENLQVHGFSNLSVCDLSVFPYSPPANPTLTLTALSLRLAQHLTAEGGDTRSESESSDSSVQQ